MNLVKSTMSEKISCINEKGGRTVGKVGSKALADADEMKTTTTQLQGDLSASGLLQRL